MPLPATKFCETIVHLFRQSNHKFKIIPLFALRMSNYSTPKPVVRCRKVVRDRRKYIKELLNFLFQQNASFQLSSLTST